MDIYREIYVQGSDRMDFGGGMEYKREEGLIFGLEERTGLEDGRMDGYSKDRIEIESKGMKEKDIIE